MPALRPRVWTVFVAYVAALGATLVAGAIAILAMTPLRQGRPGAEWLNDALAFAESRNGILAATVVSSSVLASVAMLAARLSPEPLIERLRFNRVTVAPIALLAMALGAVALSTCLSALLSFTRLSERGMLPKMKEAFQSASGGSLALSLVCIGIVPGVCEELFFRGYMQSRLASRWGRWAGITVTAAAFGLLHFDAAHAPFAAGLGLYLGWITERAGTIVVAVIAHAVNNLVAVLAASVLQGAQAGTLAMLLTSIVVLPLSILVIRREGSLRAVRS